MNRPRPQPTKPVPSLANLTIVESPYASTDEQSQATNQFYARLCLLDCITKGEAPFASHLLYTQVLDDSDPAQRRRGISTGLSFYHVADTCAVYADLGVSSGMEQGMDFAKRLGVRIVTRFLGAPGMSLVDSHRELRKKVLQL